MRVEELLQKTRRSKATISKPVKPTSNPTLGEKRKRNKLKTRKTKTRLGIDNMQSEIEIFNEE